jgi:hypothetical protein
VSDLVPDAPASANVPIEAPVVPVVPAPIAAPLAPTARTSGLYRWTGDETVTLGLAIEHPEGGYWTPTLAPGDVIALDTDPEIAGLVPIASGTATVLPPAHQTPEQPTAPEEG